MRKGFLAHSKKSFAFLYLSSKDFSNHCGVKWLLKSLLAESGNKNNLAIYFNFSSVASKKETLDNELMKILVKAFNKHKKIFGLTKELNVKSLTWQYIAKLIALCLRENHLIFLVEDQKKNLNKQTIICLQSLIRLIADIQKDILHSTNNLGGNYLFFCFFFENDAEADYCLKITPPKAFPERHLSDWLKRPEVSDLFDILTEEEIPTKVAEIRDKAIELHSEGLLPEGLLPEALLKAIYAKINCKLDDDLKKWQTQPL
jgi:hypothetical protein